MKTSRALHISSNSFTQTVLLIQQSERHPKTEKRDVQSGSPLSRIHPAKRKRKRTIKRSSKPPNTSLLTMIKKRHKLAMKKSHSQRVTLKAL